MINFLKNQYVQFKNKKFLFFILKTKILFFILFSLPLYILYFPIIVVIKFISPFLLIRFGKIESNRIGHLAGNTEIHILEKKYFSKLDIPTIDIYFPAFSPICNKYLLNLWGRYLNILPKFFIQPFYNYFSFLNPYCSHLILFTNRDRDINNLLDKTKSIVKFTQEENNIGNKFLRKINPDNKKIVCFVIRDNSYLDKHLPLSEMSYHNYRNFNLNNYFPALKMLLDLDYLVIRMGSTASKKIDLSSENLIDLPFTNYRTEFLDIFIGSKCNFVLSTSTGWDAVPAIMFRKPILICPMIPLGNLFTFSSNFMLTTLSFSDQINNKISQTEIFNSNLATAFDSSDYMNSKYNLIQNSSEDILDAVKDFLKYLNDKKIDFKDNKVFWNLYKKNIMKYKLQQYHGELKAVISPTFLKKNINLLR